MDTCFFLPFGSSQMGFPYAWKDGNKRCYFSSSYRYPANALSSLTDHVLVCVLILQVGANICGYRENVTEELSAVFGAWVWGLMHVSTARSPMDSWFLSKLRSRTWWRTPLHSKAKPWVLSAAEHGWNESKRQLLEQRPSRTFCHEKLRL